MSYNVLMKLVLCAVGALILLSSITGIFNNLVVVDTSAQPMEKVADGYDQSYNDDGYAAKNSYNNMDDKYSKYPSKDNKYECQRGPFQGFFVASVEFCDVKFQDDDKSHQDRKFICPDSGLVVDKSENCPLVCPPGSTLEGHLVEAGSELTEVCNGDTPSNGEGTCLKCADLAILQAGNGPQVEASDALIGTPTDNIFTVCEADDPRDGFEDLLAAGSVPDPQEIDMNAGFDECLDNAEPEQTQIASLQDSSLTTTVQTESAIP